MRGTDKVLVGGTNTVEEHSKSPLRLTRAMTMAVPGRFAIRSRLVPPRSFDLNQLMSLHHVFPSPPSSRCPRLVKFGCLANTATYILSCTESVLSSILAQDGVPDMNILDAARVRSMQMAYTLQAIYDSYANSPTRSNS